MKSKVCFEFLYIDIINACNLKCQSCPRGLRIMENTNEHISLTKYKKMLEIIEKQAVIKNLGLYNWSEPFLHPDIIDILKLSREFKHNIWVSTNLNYPIYKLLASLEYIDYLYISLSGFKDETHKINHKGGNINIVKKNLEILERYTFGRKKPHIYIRFLDFGYNNEEVERMREFIENLNFIFQHDSTLGNPQILEPMDKISNIDNQQNNSFIRKNICNSYTEHLALDCKGDIYLCCHVRNNSETYIGNIFINDINDIQNLRIKHDLCKSCKMPC